jgi:hypothetical protein
MFAEGAMTSPVARLLHPWRLRWLGTVAAATILLVGAIIIGIGVGTVSIPLIPNPVDSGVFIRLKAPNGNA